MACDHLFIVSHWKNQGINSIATGYTCAKCLLSAEEAQNGVNHRESKKVNARSVPNKTDLHLPGKTPETD